MEQIIEINNKKYTIEAIDKGEFILREVKKVLVDEETKYQHILLVDLVHYGKTLYLDGELQFSELDKDLYHAALVRPILANRDIRSVLIMGGGDLFAAQELLKYKRIKNVKVVDIDKRVTEVVVEYFPELKKVLNDERFELINEDAFKVIEEYIESNKKVDLLINDLVTGDIPYLPKKKTGSERFYTKEFFEKIKRISKYTLYHSGYGLLGYYDIDKLKEEVAWFSSIYKYVKSYAIYVKSFVDFWVYFACSDKKFRIKPLNHKLFIKLDLKEDLIERKRVGFSI